MRNWKTATAIVGTIALTGCFEQPLFMRASETLATGASSAAQTISQTKEQRAYVPRMRAFVRYGNAVGALPTFDQLACAGLEYELNLTKSVATVSAFSGVVKKYSAAPSNDLEQLWSSVNQDHPPPTLGSGTERGDTLGTTCPGVVSIAVNRIAQEWGKTPPPAAPAATPEVLIGSARTILDALKKVATIALQQIDIEIRTRELKVFLTEKTTADAMRLALGVCIDPQYAPKRTGDGATSTTDLDACLSKEGNDIAKIVSDSIRIGNFEPNLQAHSALHDEALKHRWVERMAATLTPAYFRYEAFRTNFVVGGSVPLQPRELSNMMAAAAEVTTALKPFDDLASERSQKGIQRALILTYFDLVRIAEGRLSDKELYEIIKSAGERLLGFGKEAKTAFEEIEDAAKKAGGQPDNTR